MFQLRPYQEDIAHQTIQVLREFGVCLLIMQMRTGKTLTALRAAQLMNAHNVLFVTKKKVIENIIGDAERLGVKFNLIVVNYEQLPKLEPNFDLIIVDEFHSVGAFPIPNKRAKDLRGLVTCPVIMLSGTPTPESYSQLFHPLWIVGFWKYKNFYQWAKDYVTVRVKYLYNRQINDYSLADFERIQKEIAPISIHYTQEQAGFEIEVKDQIDFVPMPDKVKKSIDILKRDKILILITKAGKVVLGDTAVKMMIKVHQICSGSVKAEDGEVIPFDDFKARYIKEKYEGKKIAIFYKYLGEFEILKTHFKNVAETDLEFNNTGTETVYLSQIQSGREGINLSSADCLVMFNIDYSALSYQQVRERLNVKDRVKPGVVVWVFTRGGIEEKIYQIVQKKQDFTLKHFKKLRF